MRQIFTQLRISKPHGAVKKAKVKTDEGEKIKTKSTTDESDDRDKYELPDTDLYDESKKDEDEKDEIAIELESKRIIQGVEIVNNHFLLSIQFSTINFG